MDINVQNVRRVICVVGLVGDLDTRWDTIVRHDVLNVRERVMHPINAVYLFARYVIPKIKKMIIIVQVAGLHLKNIVVFLTK
jgi:hypothetical protein